MKVQLRRAVKKDCAGMMELIRELAAYERAAEEVTVSFDHFVESGFGQQPVWRAFVAESAGTIVGFALYYVRYSTWKGQRLYLEDLIVTDKYRGQGIGMLLFNRLIELTKEQNFSGMAWQVLDWNEPAINFYRKYPGLHIDKGWLNCRLEKEE